MALNLTQLARKTLEFYFQDKKFLPDEETQKKYFEKLACFVTLTLNGELRGCIGSLIGRQKLWKDVQENAINAAFSDYRFHALEKPELKQIKIEVSVLSKSKPLKFKTPEELLEKINSTMGIILYKDNFSATFLPQVWEQIPDKEQFLQHLSIKAGLDENDWKNAEIEYYTVEAEHEE